MQKLIVALSFAFCSAAFAQDSRPFEYETTPGCAWSSKTAQCVLTNRYGADVACKITLTVKTERGHTIGNTKTVTIGAGRFEMMQAFAAPGDSLKNVASTATCKAE